MNSIVYRNNDKKHLFRLGFGYPLPAVGILHEECRGLEDPRHAAAAHGRAPHQHVRGRQVVQESRRIRAIPRSYGDIHYSSRAIERLPSGRKRGKQDDDDNRAGGTEVPGAGARSRSVNHCLGHQHQRRRIPRIPDSRPDRGTSLAGRISYRLPENVKGCLRPEGSGGASRSRLPVPGKKEKKKKND